MKSGLTILINNNHIVITQILGIVTIASKTYKGNITKFSSFLNSFCKKNSISPSELNSIIIICDITKLHLPANKIDNKIGYIQIIPEKEKYFTEKKTINNRNIKTYTFNVGLPKDIDYKENIKKAVSFFNNKGIKQIAVNSYFSLMNVERENEAVEIIKEASNEEITVISSNMYNMSNFLQRKNYLLLNLVYYNATRNLLKKLHSSFESLSIICPIYFLRSSGVLLDESSILNNSFSTWLSEYTGKIIGCSYVTNNNNSIVITKENNNIVAGSIQNYLPVCSLEFNTFNNLKIPYHFPRIIHINDVKNTKKIKEILKHFILKQDDFLPIINISTFKPNLTSLTNPIINIADSPEYVCIGAATTNYKRQFVDIVFNTNEEKNNLIKEKLLKQSRTFILNNKIILKNINYTFEITPLKYMKYSSCYIKLILEGQIGIND